MRTKLAQLIEQAVEDCIIYGRGQCADPVNRIEVTAEWAENEEDIEITVSENFVVRFTYTEKGMIELDYYN